MWRRGMFVIVFGLCFFVARVSLPATLDNNEQWRGGKRGGSWVTYVGIA